MAKGKETGTHLSRFANRGGQRVRQFIRDAAKPGGVAGDRLAFDVGRGVSDWINLWTGLLGFGASPQVGVADFGGFKGGTWKGGQDTNVLLADALPDNATFPGSGTINLAPIDGGATVNLTVTGVDPGRRIRAQGVRQGHHNGPARGSRRIFRESLLHRSAQHDEAVRGADPGRRHSVRRAQD